MDVASTVTLRLEPGPALGRFPLEIAEDIPPEPVELALPLYPDAVPTGEQQERPFFGYPATPYLKSAAASYRVPAEVETAMEWYRESMAEAGYTPSGHGTTRQYDKLFSTGLTFRSTQIRDCVVSLSFQAIPSGDCLLLYVATAITLPPRPRDSYLPDGIVRVTVVYTLPGWEERLYRVLSDPAEIGELVAAVNGLTDIAAGIGSGPDWDRGQGGWLIAEPARGQPTFVEVLPGRRTVGVGHARRLVDRDHLVWRTLSRIMGRPPFETRPAAPSGSSSLS